jgi:hypothetical protein
MSDLTKIVLAQYENSNKSGKKKNKESDIERLKRYFSTNLEKGKTIGEKIFRLLPPKAGKSPFEEVWFHELKVDDQWKKLYCPKKNHTGECPLCEIEKASMASGTKEDKDIASNYRARKFYITKGIERGKEEDGPKFWRFRFNFKKQGILDKLIPVFTYIPTGDITSPEKGWDMKIAIGKDEKDYTVVTSIMPAPESVLSDDPEQVKAWLADETEWFDVYSRSSFEFLEIIANDGVPYWDKDTESYIPKTEWEAKNKSGNTTIETLDDNGETATVIGGGASIEAPKAPAKAPVKTPAKAAAVAPKKEVVVAEANDDTDIEMDDLPF